MSVGTLGAILLGSLLTGKGIVRAGFGEGVGRAGYGAERISDSSSSFDKLRCTRVL